jgi:hypothetical protein
MHPNKCHCHCVVNNSKYCTVENVCQSRINMSCLKEPQCTRSSILLNNNFPHKHILNYFEFGTIQVFRISLSRTFSNLNVWNATLLVFRVHDVIRHFILPYFFKLQRLKCNVTCFPRTWRHKTFHFTVLFQTATFEMQRYLFSAYMTS